MGHSDDPSRKILLFGISQGCFRTADWHFEFEFFNGQHSDLRQTTSIDCFLPLLHYLCNPNEALFDRKLQPKSAVGWQKASFADVLLAEYCSHTEFHVNTVFYPNGILMLYYIRTLLKVFWQQIKFSLIKFCFSYF